ncbi:MAG TPA: hypothetical protein ENI86_04975 [Acidimicrobiales bacterium]|nr:hypothetical protein [Acidimicrobiales bacterium]
MTEPPRRIRRARPNLPGTDTLMGWVNRMVEISEEHPEFRRMGTEGDTAVREWIVDELTSRGVRATEETYEVPTRHYHRWSLEVGGEPLPCFFMNGAEFTGPDGVSGELIHVGYELEPHVDVRGRIVVMDLRSGPVLPGKVAARVSDYVYDPDGVMAAGTFGGQGGPAPSNFPAPYYEAAARGAVGFIGILTDREADDDSFFPDPTGRVHPRIPGVFLNRTHGARLTAAMAGSSSPGGVAGLIHLFGESRTSTSGNIVVHIEGQKDDAIIVNTHHDAGWSGAVQDASGTAVVMGLAEFYSRFPSNYIQKDLWFVMDGCHYAWDYPYGANRFAEMHPGLLERTCLAIGVEHIAKRFVGHEGELVDTGEVEPRALYTPRNRMLFDAAVDAIQANDLRSTIIPTPGVIPLFGETQSYFLQDVPSFSLISFPEYLFFRSDTVDKVAADQLQPTLATILDLVDAAMYLPPAWLRTIDR